MEQDVMILVFWMLSFKLAFSLSFFTFIKRLFSFSSLSSIRVVTSAYLTLLIFILTILIPDCDSSSPVFCMMYSAEELNKYSDNRQPHMCLSQFWISLCLCLVLTVDSWLAYRFPRRQERRSGISIFLRIFHCLLWSTQPKVQYSQWSRSTCFTEIPLFFLWSNERENESHSVVSDSLQPHVLYSPWNSPGHNNGLGSLPLLLRDLPNPWIEPRSSTLEEDSLPAEPQGKPKNTGVGSHSLSRGSSLPRGWAQVSYITGRFFTVGATREVLDKITQSWLFVTPWTIQSLEFSRQEYWSG